MVAFGVVVWVGAWFGCRSVGGGWLCLFAGHVFVIGCFLCSCLLWRVLLVCVGVIL